MSWTNKLSWLKPWKHQRDKRLRQYLQTEEHEVMAVVLRNRAECDEKERQIELELFREGREGSNLLINREMRMLPVRLNCERALIAARVETRKRLGLECRELLSDTELSKLKEDMLRSVQFARQSRRDDYKRRALAAGVPILRPEDRDAAEYGELEAIIRREIRQLALARSLGRVGGKNERSITTMFKAGSEWEPLIKLFAAIAGLAGAVIGVYRLLHQG